ncbi:hypothetical protein BC938DRAFT_473437 [Jimgerdemannia flammicorona]|uniref:Uncharacterized protein n=1 Tax=Jimgerdemannia flammicorona TaxID=994334 RepID=A0A433Q4E9_9FUNG|nr:hypothetical protein BC938DRAFT_473437 [Jimgerdemannia flammicorona]
MLAQNNQSSRNNRVGVEISIREGEHKYDIGLTNIKIEVEVSRLTNVKVKVEISGLTNVKVNIEISGLTNIGGLTNVEVETGGLTNVKVEDITGIIATTKAHIILQSLAWVFNNISNKVEMVLQSLVWISNK